MLYIVKWTVGENIAHVKIDSNMIKKWGITAEELHATAINNINNISLLVPIQSQEPFLFVLSTTDMFYGAAAVLCGKKLEELFRIMGDSFYLLPSSTNEMLATHCEPEGLLDIVFGVNKSGLVSNEEILSNSVYHYNPATKQVELYATETGCFN